MEQALFGGSAHFMRKTVFCSYLLIIIAAQNSTSSVWAADAKLSVNIAAPRRAQSSVLPAQKLAHNVRKPLPEQRKHAIII